MSPHRHDNTLTPTKLLFSCPSPPESGRRPGRQRRSGRGRSARRARGQRDGVDPPAAHVPPAAGAAQQPLLPAERGRLLGPARRLHQDQTAGRRAGPQRGNRKEGVAVTALHAGCRRSLLATHIILHGVLTASNTGLFPQSQVSEGPNSRQPRGGVNIASLIR